MTLTLFCLIVAIFAYRAVLAWSQVQAARRARDVQLRAYAENADFMRGAIVGAPAMREDFE